MAVAFSLVITHGQAGRVELITRSTTHPVRKGSGSNVGAPEVSGDGRFILFLNAGGNGLSSFSNIAPIASVPNLYLMDRQSGAVELVSMGFDGLPANEAVVNFQMSTNTRRILFETRASNIMTNDSNGQNDVFIRDLDLRKTILVTATTNNVAARSGGKDAVMSADGSRVAFFSNSSDLDAGPFGGVLFRDLTVNTNVFFGNAQNFVSSRDSNISEDGNVVVFNCNADLSTGLPYSTMVANLYDARIHKYALVGDPGGTTFPPVLSGDGRYVFYDTTNKIVRFNVATKQREDVITDDAERPQPIASSYDGTTLVFFAGGGAIWKESSGLRSLPPVPVGEPGLDPVRSMELSRDGKFVVFVADAPERVGSRAGRQIYFYDIEGNSLKKISTDNDGLGVRDEGPPDPAIAADGSVVVFSAVSEVMDAEGLDEALNLFAWDRASGSAELLTRAQVNEFENTDGGDSNFSERDAISDDGQKIVYASTAAAGAGDTNGTWDIFLLDRATGARRLLSVRGDGTTGNAASYRPIISGNGQFVAFLSAATNLLAEGGPTLGLYIFDFQTGSLRLAAPMINTKAFKTFARPWYNFSRDGRYLAFVTPAGLDARDTNLLSDVYVYDTSSGAASLISYSVDGTVAGSGDSMFPAISPDGKYVAFRSAANNLGQQTGFPAPVFVRTLQTGVLRKASPSGSNSSLFPTPIQFDRASSRVVFNAPGAAPEEGTTTFKSFNVVSGVVTNVCTNCVDAALSEDGQWSAFIRRDTNGYRSLLMQDLATKEERRLTTNTPCYFPRISTNGDFVVFQCLGALLTNDVNGTADIYYYNRVTGTTNLVSARAGLAANGPSLRPMLSADNSFVLFRSMASDLVANDFNDAADLFVAFLPQADSDHDGLDDAWELTEFGTLNGDGAADLDGDGLPDRQEFLAGTDPKAGDSVVRVAIVRPEAAGVRVAWKAVPGRAYRLQGSADLRGAWQDLMQPVIASSSDMEIVLAKPAAASGFYFRLVAE
jgi:Tol biopolymer transport system component